MNQKGLISIILVVATVILTGVAGFFVFVKKSPLVVEQTTAPTTIPADVSSKQTVPPSGTSNDQFSEIKECIMESIVDFNTNTKVSSLSDVETVFNKFIVDSKGNKREIFGHDPNYYKFKNATIHGTYQGKKYWQAISQWYGNDPENSFAYGKWMPEEVFDVSENGEVVRLLGCI